MNASGSGKSADSPFNPEFSGLWLAYCAWAVLLGWGLSALGLLNGWGYLAGLALAVAAMAVLLRGRAMRSRDLRSLRIPCRRFRRLFPALYLTVLAFALIGGALHPPSNYDALGYRLPRMLQWLADERWHWIHTIYHAVNTRGTVSEWVQLPFLLLGRSDRLLFLPNIISFALLPGLVFGILTRLGISRRVAWNWMWIFPSGYCFALQAGSIGNDLVGATLFLAAIHFALKARSSRLWGDFALSAAGMALATGVKPSNVPLVLPWLIAVWPAIPVLWRHPARCVPLVVSFVMMSFLPNALLNHKYCGDWTGMTAEPVMMKGGAPLLSVSWNMTYLVLQNLTPPVFPINSAYNRKIQSLIPDDLKRTLADCFQPEAANLQAYELMMEEHGPLGLAIVALLAISVGGARVAYRGNHRTLPHDPDLQRLLRLIFAGALAALLPMLIKSGLTGSGRYLAPHYLLLILPFFPVRGLSDFYRQGVWNFAVVTCFAILFAVMVISPARPLWPALAILKAADAEDSNSPALRRTWEVYKTYRLRPDVFAPIRDLLPDDAENVGLLSGNTPEASLWKPFGKRKVVHILPTDSLDSIRARKIEYIVAGKRTMKEGAFPGIDEWCDLHGAEVVATADLSIFARYGAEPWYLLRIPMVRD
jgi:hypothetical protein